MVLDWVGATYPRYFAVVGNRLEFETLGTGFAVTGFTGGNLIAYAYAKGGLTRIKVFGEGNRTSGYIARFSGITGGEATYWVSTPDALKTPQIALAGTGRESVKREEIALGDLLTRGPCQRPVPIRIAYLLM